MNFNIFLFAALAIFLAGCNTNPNHETEESHHDEVKIQLTAYSNEFELFSEADPFVVGQSSEILSHFSHLPSFKALESGSMTIRLFVNGKETSQTLEKPTRKGIYKFVLKPETAGKGQLVFDIEAEKGNFQLTVPEVEVFADDHDAIHAADDIVVSETNATVFTKEQSWKIDFATAQPKTEPFGQVIRTTARVESALGDEALISAKTNGVVKLSANNILEGKPVSNGQVLFSILGSGLATNNSATRFSEAQNNYEKARADYERLAELAKDKIVSEKELLNAKNQYENAKVIYDNLKQNFNPTGQNVASTMNGYVKQIFVQNGQYVEAGQPIVLISQNKSLLLRTEVQRKFAPIIGSVNSANIHTLHDNQTYTLEELNGKIVSVGRNTNSDNYLIPMSLQIDNKGTFVPGGFVELFLKTLTNAQALTIPNSALLEEQGNYFVFVQITPELFEKREVKTGPTDGLKTEILQGLSKDERIVTTGAVLVKLAQATGTLDAESGHNH
ncbi:efflux RND transporter periplasmic adaptor subunit [Maribellus comscasis]|uniref:Efflux RND transporter periplasmic adaptor subunit n=1 Tax=Maribellus comscasis TaxID=2681766 RepID=A0A6I6K717_9BACT|nr:efflux RND transporter periplasmic adaptor subunit [Maribellus comscasis]QGY45794.1 efflux RND transporter periplasmic adaptor subunit [Maribellus comscasis]